MMNMSKVKCRSCQSEYDENEYSRCPKCGSEEKVTFEELYKKREKEQREKEKYEEEQKKYEQHIKKARKRNLLIFIVVIIIVFIAILVLLMIRSSEVGEAGYTNEYYDERLADAKYYAEDNDYIKSINILFEIPENYYRFRRVKKLRTSYEEQYVSEIISQADEDYLANNYEVALDNIEKALLFYPDNRQLKDKKEEILARYIADYISQAERLEETGQYEGALSLLVDLNDRYASNDIKSSIERCAIKQVNYTIPQYEENDDVYGEILYIRSEIKKYNINNSGLQAKLTQLESSYEKRIENEINEMLINHRIEDATALLNEALGILPKSTVLLECKNNINAFKPVQLTEDFIVDAYAYWYEMEVKLSLEDKLRNNYAFGYQFGGNWSEKAYLTFLLKGEYEHFSAIVAPYSGWADGEDNSYAQLCVYCDNTLISTTKINRTTEPINIDVNTTGIKELKLEIIYDNGGGLIIAEPFIYAKY